VQHVQTRAEMARELRRGLAGKPGCVREIGREEDIVDGHVEHPFTIRTGPRAERRLEILTSVKS